MKLDEQGKAWECYFNKGRLCTALTDWYRRYGTPCGGCPFYKTEQQFRADLEKYPKIDYASHEKEMEGANEPV